jgi:hypothetical protein
MNMRGRLFAQPAQVQPIPEKAIKVVFYNALFNYVFDRPDVTRDNLPQMLKQGIVTTIRQIITASKDCIGIRLTAGAEVTKENCPERYKQLFAVLLSLKAMKNTDEELAQIADQIMRLDTFQEINPTQFLLEAKGLTEPVAGKIHYDESDVTPELIRTTFYNEMVTQTFLAVQNAWLLRQDLEDQEPQVYIALPALTILEALKESRQCEGIRLLNGKELNKNNCPQVENFPDLVNFILAVKKNTAGMSDQQIEAVKQIAACDKDLPEELQSLKTRELMESVGIIKNMAIEISRKRVFNEMIGMVLAMCLDAIPASPALKK